MALTPDPNTWQMLTCDPRWLHMAILAISTLQTLVNGLAGISLGWAWVCVLTVSDHSPKNLGDAPPPQERMACKDPRMGVHRSRGLQGLHCWRPATPKNSLVYVFIQTTSLLLKGRLILEKGMWTFQPPQEVGAE